MTTEKNKIPCKVLIIGSGPAGLSAAIYTARAGLETIILTGPTLGGQISLTSEIENYPGFPDTLSGVELIEKFKIQAEKFGARFDFDSSVRVDFSKRPFTVEAEGAVYFPENIILATGSKAIPLDIPGEKEFTGRGVSYCATCDGFFYRGKNVAVVGGGNSAVEEAIFLTHFASSVTIIHRRDSLRADQIIQKRAMENPKIHFLWDTVITEISGNDRLEEVQIKNVKTEETRTMAFDGLFVFIGNKPVSDLYEGQLEMENGFVKVDPYMHTNIPGVYAAGETTDAYYRQVIISAGLGAMAAITLIKENN